MEVTWNKDVLRKTNVSSDKALTAASTSTLLCNYQFSKSSTLGSLTNKINYSEATAWTDDQIVGFSMDNVVIYNALTTSN